MAGSYSNQTEYKSRKSRLFIISVFVMVFVLITSTVLGLRLGMFVANAKEADSSISISADDNNASVSDNNASASDNNSSVTRNNGNTYSGITVRDNNTVWSNDTHIELFKSSYKNGKNVVTVNGAGNKKVIAPGTENTYVFDIINTGNTTLKYDVKLESQFISSNNYVIPVEVRIKDHNGNYCCGSNDKWIPINDLGTVANNITLSADHYEQYSLEWRWKFDNDDDEYDTLLGVAADNGGVALNLKISTTAELETDPNARGGIPCTGDTSNLIFWITVAAVSFVALLVLLVFGNKRNNKNKGSDINEI